MISTHSFAQEPKKQDDTPVPFPKPEHFAAFNISGTYEFDGAVTFVLVDKTTSQFMEAKIGSENEFGIKVRAVKPGETVEKTRIQLQKGDQAGWVSFADLSAAPPVEVRSAIPTQPQAVQNQAQQGQGMQRRGSMNTPPARAGVPPNPILPGLPPSTPIPGGAPTPPPAIKVRDVPLPP